VGDGPSGEINASGEENGGAIYEGFVQGGGDTLAVRAAFRYRETDGYVYNAYLDENEGAIEETGGRLTVVWEPTDSFSANFKYTNMQRDRVGSNSASWLYLQEPERSDPTPGVGVSQRTAFASIAYLLMDVHFPDFPDIAGADFTTYKDNGYGRSKDDGIGIGLRPDSSEDELENYSLNMSWEIGGGTLSSVTGIAKYEYFDDVDVDWLPLQFIDRSDQHDFDQFSQEIRWAADVGDRFNYTVGAYYDDNELDMTGQVQVDTNFDGLTPATLGAPNLLLLLGLPGGYNANQISRNHDFNQTTESWAVFAQGTFELTDSLRVTAGLRYTEEEKEAVSDQKLGDSNCGMFGVPDTSLPGCENGYGYGLAVVQNVTFNTYNKYWTGTRKTDDLSPSVNVQWDMSDDSMLYASFSQGFKSGGFSATDDGEPGDYAVSQLSPPGAISTVPNQDFEFDDESVDAFEVGGKHEFLDGAMRLNWAAFYSEYDNLQTTIFNGTSFSVKNAASSTVQGLEVDWLFQLSDAIRVGANFAYLDATYDDFRDGQCTALQLDASRPGPGAPVTCGTPAALADPNPGPYSVNDISGYRTLYASEWSGNAFIDLRMPIGGMELFGGLDLNYRSEFDSAGDADPIDVIPSYTKVNARIGLSGDYWEVMAYGRNIFDEVAYQQSFDTPILAGSHTRFMDEGAVFGVRGTLKF